MTEIVNKILDDFGPLGLFIILGLFVIVAIITGRLVPRLFYQDALKQRDTAIEAGKVSASQVDKLLENDQTIIALLNSILTEARRKERQ